jgi:DNA-binding response OmpR family regulator
MADKKDIYIVDDDDKYLFLYKHILSEANYSVQDFNDPLKALDAIKDIPPKILILDMKMPGIDGSELMIKVSELKVINAFIPIMISSAEFSDDDYFKYASLGLDTILPKSSTPDEILSVVAEKMEEWEADYKK